MNRAEVLAFTPVEAAGVIPQYHLPEPASIPLSSQNPEQQANNERLLLYFTGHTVEQIKALSDTKGLALRRTGNGKGTRWVLYLKDWHRFMEGLPRD